MHLPLVWHELRGLRNGVALGIASQPQPCMVEVTLVVKSWVSMKHSRAGAVCALTEICETEAVFRSKPVSTLDQRLRGMHSLYWATSMLLLAKTDLAMRYVVIPLAWCREHQDGTVRCKRLKIVGTWQTQGYAVGLSAAVVEGQQRRLSASL